MPNNKSSDNTH